MSGCQTCGGYGMHHDPVAHGIAPAQSGDVLDALWWSAGQCWAMADDENPDCPIGSARCVLTHGHDDDHLWEARQ